MPGADANNASRYDTIMKLAAGGMATVWIGTVRGALGFRQLVAIKKPHPHLMNDPSFRSELIAEARLASMIHHANVVDVRDVEIEGDSISLVMDYIEGASLGDLIVAATNACSMVPPRVAVRIAVDALAGLHAAHDLVDERGRPVGLVHRDVSPQNILVGLDGIARVADFGVAKFARKNAQSTSDGSLKGKLAYMAPEYLRGENIDRRFDVFALGVVLWEALAGERCFRRSNEAETLHALLDHEPPPISTMVKGLGPALDTVLARALSKSRSERFQSAAEMAEALERIAGEAQLIAGPVEVANAVRALNGFAIEERRAAVRAKLANEPSFASLLGVPADLVPGPAAPFEVTIDTTTHMPAPPQPPRGPIRTLPLSNNVIPAPLPAESDSGSRSGSAEYVSDLSSIGLPSRRRAKWPIGLAALLVIGLVVGIAFVTTRPRASATTAATSAATAPPAIESSTAPAIASMTPIANQNPIATTPPSSLPVSSPPPPPPPPRTAAGRPATKGTSTSRKPPPNPYQDP